MSISTSDKPFLERVKESEQDKFMQASVAKSQDAQWDKREASRKELGNWPQWRNSASRFVNMSLNTYRII